MQLWQRGMFLSHWKHINMRKIQFDFDIPTLKVCFNTSLVYFNIFQKNQGVSQQHDNYQKD